MTTERTHRCGGALVARDVHVVLEGSPSMSMLYRVHGFVCNRCHEELIDRETAIQLQASQTPTIAWNLGRVSSTRPDAVRFDPLTADTLEAVAQ